MEIKVISNDQNGFVSYASNYNYVLQGFLIMVILIFCGKNVKL